MSERLPDVAARLQRWVLEAGDEDVDLILKALDLQIRVSSKEVHIEGTIPLIDGDSDTELVGIVRTSGWLRDDASTVDHQFTWILAGSL